MRLIPSKPWRNSRGWLDTGRAAAFIRPHTASHRLLPKLRSSHIIVARFGGAVGEGARAPFYTMRLLNLSRITLAAVGAAFLFLVVAAQTPRRPAGSRPATPKPTATPTPTATPVVTAASATNGDPADPVLATIGDSKITAANLAPDLNAALAREQDPYLQAFYEDAAKATREARERAVDARVASLLIAAEAKKRGKSPNDIIEAEINAKVGAPTEQEIRAAYDANRAQLGGADLESVRADLVNFLRNQRKQSLYSELITRLKMTNVVSKNADVNTPNLAPGTVLVSVSGDPLRIDTIN